MSGTVEIWVERKIKVDYDYEIEGDRVEIVNFEWTLGPLSASEQVSVRDEALKDVRRRYKDAKRL